MGFNSPLVLVLALALGLASVSHARDAPPSSEQAGSAVPPAERVAPSERKIPSLGVHAEGVPVGEDDDGAMSVPLDPDAVAWYALGVGTGVDGNVVLAAHVNWGGRPRVFASLHELQTGDQVVVIDELAREYFYEVSWSRWVRAEGAPVDEIFAHTARSELTLITCGGEYDARNRQYLDRLIVRALKI